MNLNEICLIEYISFDVKDNSYKFFDFKDYESEIKKFF